MRCLVHPCCRLLLGLLLAAGMTGCDDASSSHGPPASSTSPSTGARALKLPEQLHELSADELTIIAGVNLNTLRLAHRGSEPLHLELAAGTVFEPTQSDSHSSRFALAQDQTLELARPGDERILNVLHLDHTRWGGNSDHEAFRITPALLPAPQRDLLVDCAQQQYHWTVAQIGLWMLRDNVTSADFNDKFYAEVIAMAPDASTTFRVLSFRKVLLLRDLLQARSQDVSQYQLIHDAYAQLTKVLNYFPADALQQRPSIGYSGNLFHSLDEFTAEPSAVARVQLYLLKHEDSFCRSEAMRWCVQQKTLTASNDELFARAQDWPNPEARGAAAWTLLRRADPRGLPLLAAMAQDENLAKVWMGNWRDAMEKQTGQKPPHDIQPLPYWEKTVGYAALSSSTDITALRHAITQLSSVRDAKAQTEIAALLQGTPAELQRQLPQVARQYANHPAAFAALAQLARTHADQAVRVAALQQLRQFDRFDLYDTLAACMQQETQDRVWHELVNLPWSPDPQRRRDMLYAIAQAQAGRYLTAALGRIDPQMYDANLRQWLLELVQSDADIKARTTALERLLRNEQDEQLAIIRVGLSFHTEAEAALPREAIRPLGALLKDPAALALLQTTAREHPLPLVRAMAVSELRELVRAKQPAMEIAYACFSSETEESPRVSALFVANDALRAKRETKLASRLIIEAASQTQHEQLRKQALEILTKTSLPDAQSMLLELARTGQPREHADLALRALQRLDAPAAFAVLQQWAAGSDVDAVRSAVRFMENDYRNDARAKALLEGLLTHENRAVQAAAKSALRRVAP